MSSISVFACDHRAIGQNAWNLPFIRLGTGPSNDCEIKDSVGQYALPQYDVLLSEGTAMHWLWHNISTLGDPDYIGFCHYRRFFTSLNTNYGVFPIHLMNADRLDNVSCIVSPAQQLGMITESRADGILPARFPDYEYAQGCKDVRDLMHRESQCAWFGKSLPRDVIDKVFDLLLQNVPNELKRCMEQAMLHISGYHFNMFTLSRECFELYNSILWPTVLEAVKLDRPGEFNPRWMAYVLERLSSCVFIMMQYAGKSFIELPILMLNKTDYA